MDEVTIVMAQALQGLGHLRVSDAISHGLPKEVTPLFLTSRDPILAYSHKIVSTHVAFRALHEWIQRGWPEDLFTAFYRWSLRTTTANLMQQLRDLLSKHRLHPKTLLIVATHFGLGHQFASLKEQWEKEEASRMVVVVVVTDDTPLHLWAVGGADAVIVPSAETKRALETYHHKQHLPPTTYIVLPYMVSPRLAKPLTAAQIQNRRDQLDPAKQTPIRVSVPVSGAAVQLTYLSWLIERLHAQNSRFFFHIVSREFGPAQAFLKHMRTLPYVAVQSSADDHRVVEMYERLYEEHVIGLGITKPSEQAFKALIPPTGIGGAVMLFSDPVGKQEQDNLWFLERHHLIPEHASAVTRWKFEGSGQTADPDLLASARRWRGLRLTDGSDNSAAFILWCLEQGIFRQMADFSGFDRNPELSSDGVAQFWQWIKKTYFSRP